MKAIELIRWALQGSCDFTAGLLKDLREVPLTRTTPGSNGCAGNHALWTIGHLAFVEGLVPQVILGESNPVEHWQALFAQGSQPLEDAGAYPPFDDVLATYQRLRAGTLGLLERIGEGGLDAVPKNIPPGVEEGMKTVGRTFLLIAQHNMVHCGQLTDARRTAGLRPRF